jgi:hypothetical protein
MLGNMYNLARVFNSQRCYCEAETVFKQILADQEKILRPEHPDTLLAIHSQQSSSLRVATAKRRPCLKEQ